MASLLSRLCLCLWVLQISGKVSAEESQRITASVGDTVILPCHIPPSNHPPSVEWSKEGLDPDVVFLYRDGCETFEMKNPSFRYRTSLILSELKDGNISLRISNLQLSDKGTYRCKILKPNNPEVVATAELVVGVVSEPKLVFVPSEGGGVTVECTAGCWFPEPLLTLLDDKGSEIKAEQPERKDSGDCFTTTMRAAIQTGTNRVICRVHQPQTNQTRVTDIYIPRNNCCVRSCISITAISILLAVFGCGLSALTLFVWKKTGWFKSERRPLPDSFRQIRGEPKNVNPKRRRCHRLTCRSGDGNAGNAEMLRETEDLRSTLPKKG